MQEGTIIVVIGVSGVGKTTVAKQLAKSLQLELIEGDDYHPDSNISKMKNGDPLNDVDRRPWLEALNLKMQSLKDNGLVLACSALKESYRKILAQGIKTKIHWIVLEGAYELILDRMKQRQHFMPADLLKSQFETWESPSYGLKQDVSFTAEQIVKKVLEEINMSTKSEIGLIGLGVMGKSLCRNMARNGIRLSVYNRHVKGIEENVARDFVSAYEEMKGTQAFDDLSMFVDSLPVPRKVFLMVNAGPAVDEVIGALSKILSSGDIIIDGGNSHYKDTDRRMQELDKQGIKYLGAGVSGGEEGALLGPSIMPGGSREAYDAFGSTFKLIAAKDKAGAACCDLIGKGGSGHFVKMIHNGIEYAEMQLIAEVYGYLRWYEAMDPAEISTLFTTWNKTECSSYLLGITANILLKKEGEQFLIDLILDKAGNKGTGGWCTIAATELGVAIPTLTAALYARYQSSQYKRRQESSTLYPRIKQNIKIDIEDLRHAYQVARIINHHQGFDLIAAASKEYNWEINLNVLAKIWTEGCIIRSHLMEDLAAADFDKSSILMQKNNSEYVLSHRDQLTQVVSQLSLSNVSAPCFSSSLSYLKSFAERISLANLIQAQRDYFGAHTYERLDGSPGQKFHTNWI